MAIDRQVTFGHLFEDYPELPKGVTGRLFYNLISHDRFQNVNEVLKFDQEELLSLNGMGTKTAALLFLLLERQGLLEFSRSWPLEGAIGKNIQRKMEELRPLLPQRRN